MTDKDKTKYVRYSTLLKVLPTIQANLDKLTNKESADYKRLHMQHLYLSLALLSPTLRKEYHQMKITDNVNDTKDTDYDYLYIPANGFVQYIFNNTKKGHTTAPYELGILNNDKKNYTGQEITDIVKSSFAMFPRNYILEAFNNKPYSVSGLDDLLMDVLEDKKLGINALRSSFGTFAVASDKSSNVTKDIADKMRTSVDMLYKNYKRVDDDEAGEALKVVTITEKEKPDKNVTMKKYYDENKAKVLEQQRAKYEEDKDYKQAQKAVKYLNEKSDRTAKPETIIKHKMYEQNGRWYSEIVGDRKKK
ncbi:hypothetical protein T484DRAFT_3649331 [Baffinella frigidus]|nr:hypothetical protein T484DRAFT_3649331 [Cryptophyta sp. CCMP2293]